MKKLLILCVSAAVLSVAALPATQVSAHGGGGGGGGGHGSAMGAGHGPISGAQPAKSPPNHGPMQKAGFKPDRKKGWSKGHGLEAPDFGDDKDDGDDDGCTRVMYQGRLLWACE